MMQIPTSNLSSIINVPCDLKHFFQYWVQFLGPLKKLTAKEKLVLSHLLYKRHLLSKDIKDVEYLDRITLSASVKREIAEAINTSLSNVHVYVSSLRRKKVITGNKIHSKYIPHVKDSSIMLGIYFDIKYDK